MLRSGVVNGIGTVVAFLLAAHTGSAALSAPVITRAVPQEEAILLAWSPVEGAAGYKIYVAEKREGPYELSNDKLFKGTNKFVEGLPASSRIWYYVAAVDVGGEEGIPSKPASVVTLAPGVTTAPPIAPVRERTPPPETSDPDRSEVGLGRLDPFGYQKRFFVGAGYLFFDERLSPAPAVDARVGGAFPALRIGFSRERGYVGYNFRATIGQGDVTVGSLTEPVFYGAITQDVHGIVVDRPGTLVSVGVPFNVFIPRNYLVFATGLSARWKQWLSESTEVELRVAPEFLHVDLISLSNFKPKLTIEAEAAILYRLNPKMSLQIGGDVLSHTYDEVAGCYVFNCTTVTVRHNVLVFMPYVMMVIHMGKAR